MGRHGDHADGSPPLQTCAGRQCNHFAVGRMHRQGDGRFGEALRGCLLPVDAIVQAEVQAGTADARVRAVGENVECPIVEAAGQQMEVCFALQTQLSPGLSVTTAFNHAEGGGQAADLGRMTAAVDYPADHGIAHVVVFRSGGLAPASGAVDGQPVVAGYRQP